MVRLFALLALTACAASPPVLPAPGIYRLISIDGEAFPVRATISFPAADQIAGSAPCNSYSGTLPAALPAFSAVSLTSTEMGCDDLPAEAVFFAALSAMTRADVTPSMVSFSNLAGHNMIFVQP